MSATTSSSTTHLPMFSPLAPLSTRILSLSGFPPELKTRDIQSIFQPWEDDRGGFKIKWVDDTNALVIFNDASVAKRAYLHTLMSPPACLISTTTGEQARVRPYDGDDASGIIASVQNRHRSRSSTSGSFSGNAATMTAEAADGTPLVDPRPHSPPTQASLQDAAAAAAATASSSPTKRQSVGRAAGSLLGHRRHPSGSNPSLPAKPVAAALFDAAQGGPSPARHLANAAAAEKAAAEAEAAAAIRANAASGVVMEEEEEGAGVGATTPSGQHTPTPASVDQGSAVAIQG